MFLKMNHAAAILAIVVFFSACAKKPESPLSPAIKVIIETRGTDKVFIVEFNCALKNENDSTAFINVAGKINIKDDAGEILLAIPFTVETILPFDSGIVLQRLELKENEAAPLMKFFGMTTAAIELGEDAGARPVEEKNIEIAELKLEKKDIIKLLRGK